MIFLLGVGVPIAYLVVLITLLVRRHAKLVGLSVMFFGASVAAAIWAIDQSRSSTAGIAFLALPMLGAFGGFLGLAFGRYRSSTEPSQRIGAWAALAAALLLVVYIVTDGLKTKTKNRVSDD